MIFIKFTEAIAGFRSGYRLSSLCELKLEGGSESATSLMIFFDIKYTNWYINNPDTHEF